VSAQRELIMGNLFDCAHGGSKGRDQENRPYAVTKKGKKKAKKDPCMGGDGGRADEMTRLTRGKEIILSIWPWV